MADVIGLVASVLQLVDTVAQARNYIKDFRDAPQDQQRLLLEIQNLHTLLQALDKRVRNDGSRTSGGMEEVQGSLVELKKTLDRLTKKLDPKGISKVSSRLTWPFWGKEDVQNALIDIERFKSLVNSWLGLDNWDFAQETLVAMKDLSVGQREYRDETLAALTSVADEQRTDSLYLARSVRDVARNQERYYTSSEREKIIEWFSPLNFFQRQADILSTRQAGTGKWFLQNDLIKEWKSGTGKRVWCRGIPGAGKTVLASALIHDLRAHLESPDTGVAVIYLNHRESGAQSPAELLAGVWRQLIFGKSVSSTVHSLYTIHREQRTKPSLEETHSVLSSALSELSSAFIVVDALDEYPEEQRETLVRCLLRPNVNLLLTSRPHINVEDIITRDLEVLEVRADEDDVRRYIEAHIAKSSRLSKHVQKCPSLRGEIERRIISRSDGMFLLAKLNIDALVTKHTVKALRDALRNMPDDLNRTYDNVMERIHGQSEEDRRLALCTLSWVSNAETVLHISELLEALAIEPETMDLDPDNMVDIDLILSVCAGLVVVSEEDRLVRLIHYTAQDYLDRIQDSEFPHAQTEIAEACLAYLSFQKFATTEACDPKDLLDENPLLEYALLFGLIHAQGIPERRIQDKILRFLTYLSTDGPNIWETMRSVHTSLPRTRLGIAAYFGMLEVTNQLIEEDKFDIGALRAATTNGHTQVVRVLMKSRGYREYVEQRKASHSAYRPSSKTNTTHSAQCITPLQAAALEGNEESVYVLLESGADVNAESQPYGTALHAAAASGHYPVVCILLANGAEVNSQSGMYHTPLRAASLAGHTDIVLLLLDNGAQIDVQAGKHGSALAAALSCGREEVAHLLIDYGANVNDPGARGWTVLGLAAGNGHLETVRLLLEKGAAVNASSEANRTALQAARSGGHREITLLLEKAVAQVHTGG